MGRLRDWSGRLARDHHRSIERWQIGHLHCQESCRAATRAVRGVIEYRWANDQLDRLPTLAAELVRRQVAVIAAPNTARHWRPRRPPAAAWPLAARAQQVGKVPKIGYLSPGSASPGPLAYHDEFQRGLRELGYVEGRNIIIEYRFADGKFDRLDQFAAELVRLDVDIIVSAVTQASLAAKNATSTVPIVIVSVADPVGAGLVASLARPGANVTGTSAMTSEVIGKSLALLKQTVPTVSPVAVLWNPNNEVYQGQILRETEMAAGKLGVELQTFGVRTPDEFDRTFAAITSARAA